MHFLVFSCLGHNGKFVRSSNAREILCLVSKILCVVRYKGGARLGARLGLVIKVGKGVGWGKVNEVAKASYSDLLGA